MLVTGGAGFIGSNFVHYVLKQREDVQIVVLDALTYAGNMENLASVDPARCTFIRGDIRNATDVDRAIAGCDWVVHFAAESHVDRSIATALPFVHTNVEGTLRVLEAARTHAVTRFIQISTDEVYGNAQAPDGLPRPSRESDPFRPFSPYAASKAGAESLVYAYWQTYRLPVVITRSSNNYGPRQHPEKQLPLFITRALADQTLPIYGNGRNTRDWIYVDDHCAAILTTLLADAELVVGEIFNIGTGQERSVLENAQAVLQALEKPESLLEFVTDRPGHVLRHAVDTTKIRERLQWAPTVSFEQGISRTINWYKNAYD